LTLMPTLNKGKHVKKWNLLHDYEGHFWAKTIRVT